MDLVWILLIVFGCLCIAVVVIGLIYWRFCNGCRSRERALSMTSNRPRIYSIYSPETVKKTNYEDENHLKLPQPETRARRTVTISEDVEIREFRSDTGENSRPQSALNVDHTDHTETVIPL
ncbi:hypothetical protein PMAYCL1PPCAC_24666 [Pristionchus mayeri]|uniref:Uncharacterized protein n=1 Tax=Pristionchus mayeri TaxID=1317129 RepID=A0AAN5D093_9BILA|nr:hypothetical protein PMAYCL1PPCAC_24666 [Pristionchus mayeri]